MNRFSLSKQQVQNSPSRVIAIVAYPGVEILDVIGPMDVFFYANAGLRRAGLTADPVYRLKVLAREERPITTLSNLQISPVTCYETFDEPLDTLIIPGGMDPEGLAKDTHLIEWIRTRCQDVRRIASVCNGAFALAESGLFNGRKATTHWDFSSRFRDKYPSVDLEPDRIFVHDGPVWSSGGITSGIDLALAMVEDDWGHKLALRVARYLVVFLKRQGGQSQYSDYLKTDAASRRDFRDLQAWIIENVQEDLRVEVLAARMAMSPRNFARTFLAETGVTPAKYVEMVRTDLARHFLESTRLNVSVIAEKAGFKDTETMRKTFVRHVGISPIDYRARFGSILSSHDPVHGNDSDPVEQTKQCIAPLILERGANVRT